MQIRLVGLRRKGASADTVIADELTLQPDDVKVDSCICNLYCGKAKSGCFAYRQRCHDTKDFLCVESFAVWILYVGCKEYRTLSQ